MWPADLISDKLLEPLGEGALAFFGYIGGVVTLLLRTLAGIFRMPWGRWLSQMVLPWRWPQMARDRR